MKKTRILALVIAILSLTALLFLVSCQNDSAKGGSCAVTDEGHKWSEWKSMGDNTCTEDGTRTRKCPVCKKEESEPDPDTATGHYYLSEDYKMNDDATCTTDGTETAVCFLCGVATETRVAVDSALGHRYGNNPVSSFNGYNVFVCLRDGCGHEETFDNGTIDEDFEHTGNVLEDNSKRYFNFDTATFASIVEGTDNKYLMLNRTADRLVGNTAFGIFLTPDYDLYKSKDYVVSYDIIITENTRDLVLLSGKKANTEQVFASYDCESKSIVVNGKSVYPLKDDQFGTAINLAFVLDDANFEFDMYVNKSLYVSKAIYDKKDTYYLAADIDYLCIRMAAEPNTASEFGIDNIKTYVGKTVTDPVAPSVSENVTSTMAIPYNIMGEIDMEWIEAFKSSLKGGIGNNYTDAKFDISYAYESIEKDGKFVDVITWKDYNSGIPYFNIYDFEGLETYTLTEANAGGTNYDFSDGKTYQVYDLSGYESITINFYCDMTSEELAAMGRAGYQMLIAFYTPNAWRNDKNNYWSTYTQQYYTFTAEDVLNGEDGWQSVTIPLSKFNQTQIKRVTHFTLTAKGWGSDGVGVGLPDGSNNNNNAVDGTSIKIQSITLDKPGTISHAKLGELCDHTFGATKTIDATCTGLGYSVKVCDTCKGEQVIMDSFVAATGHNYEIIKDVAASCTDNGYYSEKCLNCNDKIRYDREATGHTESTAEGYTPNVIAPTCYSTGITERTCGVCNAIYNTDVTDMIDHTWGEGVVVDPTCTEAGKTTYTCIFNGEHACGGVKEEEIAALGHEADPSQNGEYVPATCDKGGYTPSKCVRCGFGLEIANNDDKKLGHDWKYDAENEKTVLPTCYAEGTDFFYCSRCTKTKTEVVPATGEHVIDYTEAGYVTITEPTCTTVGNGGHKCTNDGCTFVETNEIPMVDHVEDTSVAPVVTAPVCGVDGYTTRTCATCGGTYKTDIVEAEEHDDGGFPHDVQEHACDQDGYDRYTCTKCGVVVTVSFEASLGGHKYETVIDDEAKALVSTCTVCGKVTDPTVDKLPTFTEMVEALGGGTSADIYAYLNLADKNVGTTGEQFGHTASEKRIQFCSRQSTATVCDNGGLDGVAKYIKWQMRSTADNDTAVSTHSYVNLFPNAPQGAQVTFEMAIRLGAPGADGKYQANTFQIIDRGCAAIAAGGNQFINFADWTETGALTFKGATTKIQFTQDKFTRVTMSINLATNKLDIYVDGLLVEQNAKFLAEGDAAKFDMTKLQIEEVRMFNYADNNNVGLGSYVDLADIILYLGTPHAITGVDYCAITGNEHEEDTDAVQVIAPTCTERGYTIHSCKSCPTTWVDTYVDATGHTEYEPGEEYMPIVVDPTCFTKGYTKRQCATCQEWYVTDETEMVAHTMGTEPTDYIAPTCTEAGYDVFTCTVPGCGHTERSEYEAKGHSADSIEFKVVPPTCTAAGYTVKTCPDCMKNFKTDELPANGHVYGEFVVNFYPTCTEKGKQTKACQNCKWTASEEIAALGHTWVLDAESEFTYESTCYADGANFFNCSVCGDTKTEAVTVRPDHTYGEEKEEVAPTCTTTGKMVKYCTVEGCDAFSDRVTPKLGHKLEKDGTVTVAPTCTEVGTLAKACERCDYIDYSDVAPIGHDLVKDPENNTFTCTQDGVEAYMCTRCDYTEATDKAATGHSFTGTPWIEDYQLPTCYADGIRTRKCANCDALMHLEGTDAEKMTCVIKTTIPHNMVAGEVIEPTVDAQGYTLYSCSNEGCDHTEKRDFTEISSGTQGFVFVEIDGGYYIESYNGTDTDIIIPATYLGKPVIGIAPSVFSYSAITSLTIESDNIFTNSAVDYGIFAGCNLEYVVLGEGVTYVPFGVFEGTVIGTLYNVGGAYVEDIDMMMVEIGNVVDGPKED